MYQNELRKKIRKTIPFIIASKTKQKQKSRYKLNPGSEQTPQSRSLERI
jgi:hypothetical protein